MTNEVQAAQPNAVAMPDYLMGYAKQGVGQIKVDMKELRVPLLKMIQLQGEQYDAAKNNFGNIFDSISGEDFGKNITVVVVDYKPEWMKWSSDRKLLGLSTDGVTWQRGEEAYVGKTLEATEGKDAFKCKHYNYYVLLLENGVPRKLPYKLSLSGMSAKAGDKMYQVLAQRAISSGYPMFSFMFNITVSLEKGEKGQYSVIHADMLKEYTSVEVAKVAAEFVKTLQDPNTKIIEKEETPVANAAVAPTPSEEPAPEQVASVGQDPLW